MKNFSESLKETKENDDFFDVTLACEDDQIEAHKLVLSACSSFFRNILKRNPHAHPLLYLKGVKIEDLRNILEYMYSGEVRVESTLVTSFLQTAEDLQVRLSIIIR